MRIFYSIWVDSIIKLRTIDSNKNNWKVKSMITMSIAMTFNLIFLMAIVQRNIMKFDFYKIEFSSFSNLENNILSIILLFLVPCVILNYLCIFRGNRYEKLINKYHYHKGKWFLTYFLLSLFIPIITLWIGILLSMNNII
jgi:hypothetical protein